MLDGHAEFLRWRGGSEAGWLCCALLLGRYAREKSGIIHALQNFTVRGRVASKGLTACSCAADAEALRLCASDKRWMGASRTRAFSRWPLQGFSRQGEVVGSFQQGTCKDY